MELTSLRILPQGGTLPYRTVTTGGFFEIGESICLEPPDAASGYNFTWYKNGQPLPGITGPSLCLSELTPGDSGLYLVEYENVTGEKAQTSYSFFINVSSSVPVGGTVVYGVISLAVLAMGLARLRRRHSIKLR